MDVNVYAPLAHTKRVSAYANDREANGILKCCSKHESDGTWLRCEGEGTKQIWPLTARLLSAFDRDLRRQRLVSSRYNLPRYNRDGVDMGVDV